MSIASSVLQKLESCEWERQGEALKAATSLSAMVCIVLQMGLMIARWLLEDELEQRGQAPTEWSTCPKCGHRLNSKGWQARQILTLVGLIR